MTEPIFEHLDANHTSATSLSILLVEDEPAHAEMARRSLLCSSPVHRIIHVEDGQAALDYLHRKNAFENLLSEPLPDLILLDLNMPKMGGFEVLRQIRENQELRKIPSVVLTTSADPMDKEDALRLGAAGFQTKPMSPESFTELLGNFPCNLLSFS